MNYLQCLVEKIHTVIAATVDENGKPVTCAIDMMDFDESGLYFLTAKGKGFYQRLKNKEYIALSRSQCFSMAQEEVSKGETRIVCDIDK